MKDDNNIQLLEQCLGGLKAELNQMVILEQECKMKINDVRQRRVIVKQSVKQLEKALAVLKKETKNEKKGPQAIEYENTWSYKAKALHFINQLGGSTPSEVAIEIHKREPDIPLEKIKRNVATNMGKLYKQGIITKENVDNRNIYTVNRKAFK
jgi:hypothetical protein